MQANETWGTNVQRTHPERKMKKPSNIDPVPHGPLGEMRTSGQLAATGGAYACTLGCGAVVLVDVLRPLPVCPRCMRRTTWRHQPSGTFRIS